MRRYKKVEMWNAGPIFCRLFMTFICLKTNKNSLFWLFLHWVVLLVCSTTGGSFTNINAKTVGSMSLWGNQILSPFDEISTGSPFQEFPRTGIDNLTIFVKINKN